MTALQRLCLLLNGGDDMAELPSLAQLKVGMETLIEMDTCAADGLEAIVCYLVENRDIPRNHSLALARIVADVFEKRRTLRRDFN